jgi:hypothetical protein
MQSPNTASLAAWWQEQLGSSDRDLLRAFRTFHAAQEPFRTESVAHE